MTDYDLSNLSVGSHSFTAKAKATDYADSDASNAIVVNVYAINVTALYCQGASTNPTKIYESEETVTLTFTIPSEYAGFSMPDSVTVTGATSSWDKATGTLTLSNATGTVSVAISATPPNFLCFTPDGASANITFAEVGGSLTTPPVVQYTTDFLTWNTVTLNTAFAITGPTWFKGDNTTFAESSSKYTNIQADADFTASGDFRSLIDYSVSTALLTQAYVLYGLCKGNSHIDCNNATIGWTLLSTSNYCYAYMFQNCTRLTTTPSLPATASANSTYSYTYMFNGCTRLTTIPTSILCASEGECANMFQGCTSLTYSIPIPRAGIFRGYKYMFQGCTSLTTAGAITLEGAMEALISMFSDCTSLVVPPAFNGTVTSQRTMFDRMFSGCTALATVPTGMSNVTFTLNPYRGMRSMFYNCIRLVKVPRLTLTKYEQTLESMFEGCLSLIVSDIQTSDAQHEWAIPYNGVWSNSGEAGYMFTNCQGTRASDNLTAVSGSQNVYYTQYEPVA